jgi:hypothetical protein
MSEPCIPMDSAGHGCDKRDNQDVRAVHPHDSYGTLGDPNSQSTNAFSNFAREGCRSLRSALASI